MLVCFVFIRPLRKDIDNGDDQRFLIMKSKHNIWGWKQGWPLLFSARHLSIYELYKNTWERVHHTTLPTWRPAGKFLVWKSTCLFMEAFFLCSCVCAGPRPTLSNLFLSLIAHILFSFLFFPSIILFFSPLNLPSHGTKVNFINSFYLKSFIFSYHQCIFIPPSIMKCCSYRIDILKFIFPF